MILIAWAANAGGMDAGPYSSAAESKLLEAFRRILDTVDGELNLAGVAAKFLAQSNRRSVVQMRPADLYNVIERVCLLFPRTLQANQSGQKIFTHPFKRGDVNRARNDIVARLSHIR